MTILYTDPLFLKHDTGRHPESAGRLRSITKRLEKAGLISKCTPGEYHPLTEEALAKVHAAKQIQTVKQVAEHGGGRIEADTVVSAESFKVAAAAAGACVAAVDAVLKGNQLNALCLVRPPGHHATQSESMGFCLFNSIALAAQHAKSVHGLNRILIVDWDVHHGNGTQDIFYEDPSVMFFSIHRYGNGFYPGTGAAEESGRGRGVGFTKNVPLPGGATRSEYHQGFKKSLEKIADSFKPELVLVSAGFDGHREDPIGNLGLDVEDFQKLTFMVKDIARYSARGRLVSCLEGGYNIDRLAECVQVHLEELLK